MSQQLAAKIERRAWSLVELAELDKAIAAFDEAIAVAPNPLPIQIGKGVALYKLAQHRLALEVFDALLAADPNQVIVLNNKGMIHVTLGEETEALDCYKKILALDPNHVRTWFRAGELMRRLEKYDKALNLFAEAIRLKPDEPDYWHGRASVLVKVERFDEALEHYGEAIKLDLAHFNSRRDRGVLYRELGRYEESIDDFTLALKEQPKSTAIRVELGRTLLAKGEGKKALGVFQGAIELDKDCAEAWTGKGDCLTAQDEPARGALNRGTAHMIKGNLEDALQLIEQAIELDENYAEAWSNKGVVLERMERFEEAAVSFEKALSINGDAVIVMHNLAMLCINKLDRHDDGIYWLRQGIRREPDRWFKLPGELRRAVDAAK